MAELASGAVSSLLGVIRNEARLLGRVKGDVQFIKEEMESMHSFLLHLARTAPPGGEHDEQVRTWMNQVRLLAQDCNNCIDLYLYRGNPDIHRARGGLRRYLWWLPWFLQKMAAQHHAAIQLRELKERARDVGERRLRYGVQVPEKAAAASGAAATSAHVAASAAGGEGDGDDDDHQLAVATAATDHSGRRAFFDPGTLEDYFKRKLREWIEVVRWVSMPSIAIVAPHTDQEACALAREALDALDVRHVLVDIPAVHLDYNLCLREHLDYYPLRPKDILYYILRELELRDAKSQSQTQQQEGTSGQGEVKEQHTSLWRAKRKRKLDTYWGKKKMVSRIKDNIRDMEVDNKLEKLKSEILQVKDDQLELDGKQMKDGQLEHKFSNEPLGALLLLLLKSADAAAGAAVAEQDQLRKKRAMPTLAAWYTEFIKATAKKLKDRMEAGAKRLPPISLHQAQYEHILREVFPKTSDSKAQEQATKITTTTLDEDQAKEIVDKVKQEILWEVFPILITGNSKPIQVLDQELDNSATKQATTPIRQEVKEDKSDRTQATVNKPCGQGQIPDSMVTETMEKIKNIKKKIKAQMKIKWIVDRIEEHLKDGTMIIFKIDETMDRSLWEETRNTLSLLDCMIGALIITTTKSIHGAKEYCYPSWEPIECSLVGLYYATVLALTSQKMQDNYNPQIFRNILDKCEPHEFCMKLFTHALYTNPKRSHEELRRLHHTLQEVPQKSFVSIANKIFKFSYNDMPKEYKSCLLYLAIFPQGHNIRRSTLIGRWVAEGLITKEDWLTSVHQAERCFDTLIDRWFVYPADIGATGEVKSCVVGSPIHGFITKIARKQHIVQIRLSLHLARHFSIFSDVQLRGSDGIEKFLKRLSESPQLSLIKVLDLEGCHCFGGRNQRYLKDICSKILLLKYLSLKGTDTTQLPSEINNLHELEVLDIRQTKVPASATKHILLLKLKRLLAGHSDPSPSTTGTSMTKELSCVRIPYKIEKMVNMEVLYNVKASQSGRELKDIRNLWQLRKLGVVIIDKDNHLSYLLQVISDLHECLQSLSITLPITIRGDTPSIGELPVDICCHLEYPPEVLESLSISGTTQKGQLLPLLAKDGSQLAKVTLSNTWLNQEDLKVLAKLPKLHCVRLRHKAYSTSKLTVNKDEFQNLKYFLVEGSNMTDISFEGGAASELEKIVLSFTDNLNCLSGVEDLPKLKELELNNNNLLPLFDKARQIAKVTLRGTFLRQGDLQILTKKPSMRCLALLDNSYVESQLTVNKDEFLTLNLLIVDCLHITNISFREGSTPMLEKIVWSFNRMESLSGINNLPKLKELEFVGDFVPNEVEEAIKKHKKQA